MIFQDLNNITDVYNKSGLAIQKMYNQSGDIIWEKIKSSINTITNYGDICWFSRFGYDKNHKIYFPFMGPVATDNSDTYLRMYRRDMNTFINSEYYGLWIVNGSKKHTNMGGHIDISYILGKNRLINPYFSSCNLLWENTTIGYFSETEDEKQVNGAGYELCLDVSKLVNQSDETGGRYTYIVQRLPIYAGNSKNYTYPNGQLYMCWLYDDILQLISDVSIYVVRKVIDPITKKEEIRGKFLSPAYNSEEVFENIINQYDLEYNNIHTLC